MLQKGNVSHKTIFKLTVLTKRYFGPSGSEDGKHSLLKLNTVYLSIVYLKFELCYQA